MHFTCELTCPAEMPFPSYDPLTGDLTCHSSSNLGSNSVYIERQRIESVAESRFLGARFVLPLAIVFLICLVCITLTCLFKRRQRRRLKTTLMNKHFNKESRFARFFDKVGTDQRITYSKSECFLDICFCFRFYVCTESPKVASLIEWYLI